MRNRRRLSYLLLPGLTLAAGIAAAEEHDEPVDSGYQEQLSVTASRTPIPINETGNSITILTREDIEARGYPFVADLLRGMPGLSIARSGPAGSQTQIRVRGAEANHVLVRIDGMDVSDLFGADELPFELMTSDDIERIEFVRGPQSGLWGSDAVAGVINIITRPSGDTGGSAQVEGGSFGTGRADARLDLGSEYLRFDIGVSRLDSDGTNISRQGSEADGTRNTTATAGLRWNPAQSRLSFEVSARHTDSESDFDSIDSTGLPVDAANVTETDLTLLQLRASWVSEQSRWSHEVALSSGATDVATVQVGFSDTSTEIDKLGASFQSSVDLGRRGSAQGHRLTLAVDHEQRDFSQRGTASPGLDPNQDQEMDNTGLAVEYRYRSSERWAASAAVRHETNSDFDEVTTFRLTGSIGFDKGKTRVRAALGTGQKAPTFIERFGFFPDMFLGNPDLQPAESSGFEIGVDRQIGRRAQLALTYFNDSLENEINGFFFDVAAGVFTAVNQAGKSDRRGFEAAFEAPLGERLDLRGSYTYTDATEPDELGGTQREIRRPKHLASLAVNWRSSSNRLRVRGSLNHTGSSTDVFFPPGQARLIVDLDSYLLADLFVSVAVSGQVDVFVRGENLLDEEYEDVVGFRGSGVGGFAGIRFRGARN